MGVSKEATILEQDDGKAAAILADILSRKRKSKITENEADELYRLYGTQCKTPRQLKEIEQSSKKNFKKGKFSHIERDTVKQAITDFLNENNLTHENFIHVYFSKQVPQSERPPVYRQLIPYICRRLPGRPYALVFRLVVRMFNPRNYKGVWRPEEDEELLRLHEIYGNDWEKIGVSLDRYGVNCRDRFKQLSHQSNQKKGQWTPEEIRLLIEAVESVKRNNEGKTGQWDMVSEKVGTRTISACIHRWSILEGQQIDSSSSLVEEKLNSKSTGFGWNPEMDYYFLCRLYDLGLEHESEIVWKDVCDSKGPYPHIKGTILKSRFLQLKRRVRGCHDLDLDSLLESLLIATRTQLDKSR